MGRRRRISSAPCEIQAEISPLKALKILLYLVLGLVVLVVAAVAIFAMTFDPNRYKDDIQRIVKDKTGRTLELKGPLELAFWPSLGAKVSGVVLSEHGTSQPFVSLESAHASVALLPLLRGGVTVDRVRLSGLRAQIVKDKDGRFNFQDLIEQGGDKPAAKAEKKAPDSKGGPVAFDIAGVTIERAALSYRDLASGHRRDRAWARRSPRARTRGPTRPASTSCCSAPTRASTASARAPTR